jgi:hypothetical protein
VSLAQNFDHAIGFVDLIEQGDRHRAHVNLGY